MLKREERVIKEQVKRLKELASLENAGFHFAALPSTIGLNQEEKMKVSNEAIKKEIKPYMMWFYLVAQKLEELLPKEN